MSLLHRLSRRKPSEGQSTGKCGPVCGSPPALSCSHHARRKFTQGKLSRKTSKRVNDFEEQWAKFAKFAKDNPHPKYA